MKKILVLLLGVAALPLLAGCSEETREIATREYSGAIPGFVVEISETDYENPSGTVRTVRLYPTHENPLPHEMWITGVDEDDDGQWERITYCHYPHDWNGCNATVFTKTGEREWEPCPADKGRMQPPLLGEILFAKAHLNQAMMTAHRRKS